MLCLLARRTLRHGCDMGQRTRHKEKARIRERMAALLAEARSNGEVIAKETATEIVPSGSARYPAKLGVRGPQKAPTKEAVSIRLDADLLEELRNSGKGWQTRVNAMLRDVLTKTP